MEGLGLESIFSEDITGRAGNSGAKDGYGAGAGPVRTVQADSGDEGHDDGAMKEAVVTVLYKGQGVIRYHPARPRKEGREQRKKMAVLEINDWDDS
eukprot:scaffold5213_cov30-Phaeocystis_antarctica.AAC.1